MKEKVTIQYSVDEKDFINFRYTNFIPAKFRTIGYIFIAFVLFSVLTNQWMWNLATGQSIKIGDFSSAICVIFVFCIIYYIVKKQYKSSEAFQKPMKLEATKDEITFEGHGYNSRIQWSSIYKVIEKKNYFAIFTQKQIGNIISKSKMSEQEIIELKTILSRVEGLDYSPMK